MKKLFMTALAMFLSLALFTTGCSNKKNSEDNTDKVQNTEKALLKSPDLTFFELQGPVKVMTMYDQTFEFDENGNLTKVNGVSSSQVCSRDNEGRIISIDDEYDYVAPEYFWDSERPTGYYEQMIGEIKFTYDDRGYRVTEQSENGDVNITYTYDKIDEFGNWLSRVSSDGETIVRTIEYYEASATTASTDGGNEKLALAKKAAGPFVVGAKFPSLGKFPQSNFTIKMEDYEEGLEEYADYEVLDGETIIMKLVKCNDVNDEDIIGEITVYSPEMKTAEGIGVGSTIEEFYNTYNNVELCAFFTGNIVLECDQYKGCQFMLSESDYKKDLWSDFDSDMKVLKPSDFKTGAKIKAIRIY